MSSHWDTRAMVQATRTEREDVPGYNQKRQPPILGLAYMHRLVLLKHYDRQLDTRAG